MSVTDEKGFPRFVSTNGRQAVLSAMERGENQFDVLGTGWFDLWMNMY